MIRFAQIKLTILYSVIFLLLFWSLSFGIYFWMNTFLGDRGSAEHDSRTQQLSQEPPNDSIMDNLRNILLIIDVILLITIPAITWFLTGDTLAPVQKAHKREQRFLTDASHELRTPLTILQAEMEVALNRKRTVQEYQQIITSNKEEVDELISLMEHLLFISREQTEYNKPIYEAIDIIDILSERVTSFQKRATQKHLQLTLAVPESNFTMYGNSQLLKRLFTNVLDNAIKYTSKGTIIATIRQKKAAAIVTITDTGIGIPKEQQEKIFDRFYRAEESRSEGGYGLGLSIAKQIMNAHHGAITVTSLPEKGTTMTLTFPIRQDQGKSLS